MNKEQIYDEQISPLMTQIIAICKEHDIQHVVSFAIPTESDPELMCTTAKIDKKNDDAPDVPTEALRAAYNAIRPAARNPLMLRTDHGDGSVTMTAIL